MKILLINPNWTGIRRQKQHQFKRLWQPLDLAMTAALLEKAGHGVTILDNNVDRLSSEKVGRLGSRFDKIFVTSTPYDRWQCPSLDIGFFFDTLRGLPKNRLYVMGAHVTERPEAILRASGARAAILGEPEQAVLDLTNRDHPDRDFPPDVPGTAYLKGSHFVRSLAREVLPDLDELPYPAFHLLPMDRYTYDFMGRDFAILEGSRGCPYQCSFCYLGMHGTRFRQKSLGRFLDEIHDVVRRYDRKNIYFMDLEFALNRSYLISFCRALINRGININWCCQTRVTDVDEEVMDWMKAGGCTLIHFGVEAGSERILAQTGKGIRISDCFRAVSLARSRGIRTALFMNFGFPWETQKEMETTVALALKLNPTYAAFHMIVPFPGTPLARELGIDPESFPVTQYPHYNFVHHDLHTLKGVMRKAYLKFYLRPAYLMGLLKGGGRGRLGQAVLLLRHLWR